ncbi:hypothetical protein HQ38_08575 [Porphyromonas crevioricanis]|uniref:Uncharacterized protein n=3 Tax=Porphyromonas crevioricanis TaxID=393921 RepID=A0AB34PGN7_9PORP|nr:hypothetical protein HQ38_08575 [Porphyromonas crevioricanis]
MEARGSKPAICSPQKTDIFLQHNEIPSSSLTHKKDMKEISQHNNRSGGPNKNRVVKQSSKTLSMKRLLSFLSITFMLSPWALQIQANAQHGHTLFSINGIEINSENAHDLTRIEGVKGDEVSYNVGTNTLTLHNATINR